MIYQCRYHYKGSIITDLPFGNYGPTRFICMNTEEDGTIVLEWEFLHDPRTDDQLGGK